MMTEEQAHVQWLKEKAQSLGLTFDQYMLFLIFESLEHSPAINTEPLTRAPWMEGFNPPTSNENPNGGL